MECVTPAMAALTLELGVKTDPIEYRYSFGWLFDLMAQEGVWNVQVGTFFEIYHLPDHWFTSLAEQARRRGLRIRSVFTAHRELGGFYRSDPCWHAVARRNYERLIEVGALLGAESVGSNPGAVMRDAMDGKGAGIRRYLEHMKELMHFAHDRGVSRLTLEPMSCAAEPPALPGEIRSMCQELVAYHRDHAGSTAGVGLCAVVSHGYADEEGAVVHTHLELLEAALPYTTEVHLKNTDATFGSTFGFTEPERARGIVDVRVVRELLRRRERELPVHQLVGYLEIGGPKTGRDYSDRLLEEQLRGSLRHLRATWSDGEGVRSDESLCSARHW